MNTLILVESPAKARKIQGFFTDGTKCIASIGHLYDLDPKSLSIDVEKDFHPSYQICPGKTKVIQRIRQMAKDHRVILGADDDREGHAIAWHCARVAKLPLMERNRMTFHEISKESIHASLQNLQRLDMDSVNAQQARRVIDRLVGFSLSPLLWKHIPTSHKGLSAGRVQTTLLALLNDHEQRIRDFRGVPKVSCRGDFTFPFGTGVSQAHGTFHVAKKATATAKARKAETETTLWYESFCQNREFLIASHEIQSVATPPPAPLITSTLQRVGARSLHFSLQKTMGIAQKLYENGKITYMRTDSPTVSPDFQRRLQSHIQGTYSPDVYQPARSSKSKGAQEAHECIRVTDLQGSLDAKGFTKDDRLLYACILRHTIISHMTPALYDVLHLTLQTPESEEWGSFHVTQRYLTSPGFLLYEGNPAVDAVPTFPAEMRFHLQTAKTSYEDTRPPSSYDDSAIVKLLETSGIGRPSTYASLVQTLDTRTYTERTQESPEPYEISTFTLESTGALSHAKETKTPEPHTRIRVTPLGSQVLTYLQTHFPSLFQVSFTAQVETDLDRISQGELDWVSVVRKVYDSFIGTVHLQTSRPSQKKGRGTANAKGKERHLGMYQGSSVILKEGPYGPYLSHGTTRKSLKYVLQGQTPESLCLSDVKDLLRYPLKVGTYEGHDLMIHLGPYGTYLKYRQKNYKVATQETYTLSECLRCLR